MNSINYVACHDGFTLRDLVSYNYKHNESNGENSGDNNNISFNYGVEGDTANPEILALRLRQRKNFFAVLLLSQGVPMFLAGDECGRTQQGNNNPYLQDNEISWFDWRGPVSDAELLQFVKAMIAFRMRHDALRNEEFLQGRLLARGLKDVAWHGCKLNSPGWNDPHSGVLAFTLADPAEGEDLHAMLNMEGTPLPFEIPPVQGRQWHRAIDTSLPAGSDIMKPGSEVLITTESYIANGRSIVVLVSK
jgi:glycogen operon protein